ncbi:hypothetical protein [uncultured Methanoregula sp.]|uniref:hypothetical protein n=1 Tax=uncultured Methanoregula sp. TaxID=1005933 RepID=UPI002AABFE21|nr:hypothetical protein [uncultured Methanoregula sp.]
MEPEPEPAESLTPAGCDDLPWFTLTWQNLPWSPWVPFSATKQEFRIIPHVPGLYRIRPAGKDFLLYISETSRTLHQRLNELRLNLRRDDLMPWNDPDTSAPALWAWRDAEGYEYECSAAPLDASAAGRRAMESFLLYRYRQETGESTTCNFGRFHPRYRRSTNKNEGLRGGKLKSTDRDNPAGGPGIPPLCPSGSPGDDEWMGISWSRRELLEKETAMMIPACPGLYLLSDGTTGEILFIGQSMDCRNRLLEQGAKEREGQEVQFSYHIPEAPVLPHNLRELECDLLGSFFEHYRKAPARQFRVDH